MVTELETPAVPLRYRSCWLCGAEADAGRFTARSRSRSCWLLCWCRQWAAGAVAAPFSRCGLPVLWLPPFALGLMVLRQTTLGVPGLVSVGGGVADAFFFSTPIATAKAQFISKTHRERRAKPLGREFPRSCFPEESSRRQCPGRQCRLQQESPRAPSLVRKSLLRINTIADVVHVILIYRLHNVGCEANVESVAEMAFERRGYEDLGPL
ncbi:hypothetical protein PF011_g18590 [Phytophthora fragariae]|uniref:Uncharacterized protein n=1 Tax=Phytophthora fragariae TaxID=53985 RepID=A0A6A3J3Q1_9STRA|nr:hypothetical protein PF011_g18590 [Phytophthora fragariae]KAE9330578.1 hypothetical protein PF008_g15695 [Phytophthora fragariae]